MDSEPIYIRRSGSERSTVAVDRDPIAWNPWNPWNLRSGWEHWQAVGLVDQPRVPLVINR
jgi:hypothetical protein